MFANYGISRIAFVGSIRHNLLYFSAAGLLCDDEGDDKDTFRGFLNLTWIFKGTFKFYNFNDDIRSFWVGWYYWI